MALTQGKGQAASDDLLNMLRGTQPSIPPANYYIALFSTMPTTSDGTGAVELSGNGYARVAVSAAAGSWSAPATQGDNQTRQISNVNPIAFPTPTAAWVAAVGFGVYDAATVGNVRYFDQFGAPVTGQTGIPIQFNAGALTIGEK